MMHKLSNSIFKGALGGAALLLFGATALNAQAPGNAFSGYSKENANKPIDIESDTLAVDDKKQVAIFKGNVTAVQGDYTLRAKELEVIYERAPEEKPKPGSPKPVAAAKTPAAAGAATPAGQGQIKFIKALGKVYVTSKEDQNATGNEAYFDVKAQKITMTGDVTLVQKGNIIKGEKLAIDLETGRAIVDQQVGQRVRAVLKRDGGVVGGEAKPADGAVAAKPKSTDAKTGETKPLAQKPAPSSGWTAKSQ